MNRNYNYNSKDPNKSFSRTSKFLPDEESLSSDNVIQLSCSFSENTSAPEINYVLNNLLSDEEVADLEAKFIPTVCEYCSKENLHASESSCCQQQELDKYIKEIESKQLEDRISTYFLLRPRRINAVSQVEMDEMKRFVMEENYRRGMNIEVPKDEEAAVSSNESQVQIKLKKGSKRSFRKLKKKMDKIKIIWPQLFDSQMDPINVWGNMMEDFQSRKKKVSKENVDKADNQEAVEIENHSSLVLNII